METKNWPLGLVWLKVLDKPGFSGVVGMNDD